VFLYKNEPPVLNYSFVLMNGTLLFSYEWTGVGEDFMMPFAIVVNNSTCIRLIGTTKKQNFTYKGVSSFYIPTPNIFDENVIEPNSFTYFQTYYIRE